jgi:hypothetical protein
VDAWDGEWGGFLGIALYWLALAHLERGELEAVLAGMSPMISVSPRAVPLRTASRSASPRSPNALPAISSPSTPVAASV